MAGAGGRCLFEEKDHPSPARFATCPEFCWALISPGAVMIITIANEKGGAEKSILANNLAALCALDGRNVLLIDADPHESSLTWSNERSAAGIKPKVPARAISG